MKITETKKDSTSAEYTVTVSKASFVEKVEAELLKLSTEAELSGFRKGKVPLLVLKRRFGERVKGDIANKLIQNSVDKAVNDNGLRVAIQPNVEVTTFEDNKDLEFALSFVLLPTFDIMDLSEIKLEQFVCKVSDKEVKESLDAISKDFRDSKEVSRKSKNGDVLVIDYLGKVDGEAFAGGEAKGHSLELGSNSFISGFEEQLIGLNAGEEKDVEVTFPTEYHEKSLSGKKAIFACKVQTVKEYIATKLDDALAKKLGLKDFATLEKNVKENLSKKFDKQTFVLLKEDLLDKLDKGHKFEVPKIMLEEEYKDLWKQVEAAKSSGQLDDEDSSKTDKELEKSYRQLSVRRVKLGLLITEIAKDLEVEVKKEDIQQAIMAEVQRYPGQEQKIYEFYQKNPKIVEQLRSPILEEKTIAAIIDKADVKTKELTEKEIVSMLEDGNLSKKKSAKKSTTKKVVAKKSTTKSPTKKTVSKKPTLKKS